MRKSGRSLHEAVLVERDRPRPRRDGATLADGGVNSVTGERVIDATTCHFTLAVMATAGLSKRQATGCT